MTDIEIAESRWESWRLRYLLRRQVVAGTPSRIGPCYDANHELLGLWDYANDRQYRRPRRPQ